MGFARVLIASTAGLLTLAAATGPAAATGATSTAGTAPAASWAQTGYNAAAAQANPAETTLTATAVKRLVQLRAQTPTGDCRTGEVAALSGSLLYSVVDDVLRATRTDTGATVWQVPLLGTDEHYVSIAVSNGLIVLASNGYACETNDPVGNVLAYHASDGSLAWTGQVNFPDGVYGMAVSGSRVIAWARRDFETSPAVDVLRLADGSLLWSADNPGKGVCDTAPAVVRGLVLVDGLRGPAQPDGCDAEQPTLELRGLAAGTGKVRWTKPGSYLVLRGDTDAAAGTAHLYVRDNGTGAVLDLDPATGATRFALAGATDVVAVDQQRVYAACSTTGTVACAFDKASGALVWRVTPTHAWPRPSAVEAGGVLYLSTGELRNAATGALLRTLTGSVVAVGEGHVVAFDPADEALLLYGLR